jgi:hypothetical protein
MTLRVYIRSIRPLSIEATKYGDMRFRFASRLYSDCHGRGMPPEVVAPNMICIGNVEQHKLDLVLNSVWSPFTGDETIAEWGYQRGMTLYTSPASDGNLPLRLYRMNIRKKLVDTNELV